VLSGATFTNHAEAFGLGRGPANSHPPLPMPTTLTHVALYIFIFVHGVKLVVSRSEDILGGAPRPGGTPRPDSTAIL
jgi:hypothetical protein